MRYGINSFLFVSPFTTESTKLFSTFKKWGFDTVEIPIEDCRRYPVVLALTRDGRDLQRRDKGPIWVVYPRDDHAELRSEQINTRWVWQLDRLEVR